MNRNTSISVLLVVISIVNFSLKTAQARSLEIKIDGLPGVLPRDTKVDEVWKTGKKGEIVVSFLRSKLGADRVLLKNVDTTLVADGYGLVSENKWEVTGKRTYLTVTGIERSIFVAEPVSNQSGSVTCAIKNKSCATWFPKDRGRIPRSHITQILNDKEMLAMMYVSTGLVTDLLIRPSNRVVLIRGIDTTNLTEDSLTLLSHSDVLRFPINDTYRYICASGATRTVFVADNDARKKAEKEAEERRHKKAEQKKRKTKEERRKWMERLNKQRQEEEEKKRREEEIEQQEKMKAIEAEKALWRVWKDKDGISLFEARFMGGIINGKVILKKRNGDKRYIPLKELSKEDQEWIKKQMK